VFALGARESYARERLSAGIAQLRLERKQVSEADLAKARQLDPKLAAKAAKLGIAP
jgi:hypothetical protein